MRKSLSMREGVWLEVRSTIVMSGSLACWAFAREEKKYMIINGSRVEKIMMVTAKSLGKSRSRGI